MDFEIPASAVAKIAKGVCDTILLEDEVRTLVWRLLTVNRLCRQKSLFPLQRTRTWKSSEPLQWRSPVMKIALR